MKLGRTLGAILGVVAILVAAAAAISYVLYRSSCKKVHNEKWEDYIDCGLA